MTEPTATCWLCPGGPMPAADIDRHLQRQHPDADSQTEAWPDGRPYYVDVTLEPADFGAQL